MIQPSHSEMVPPVALVAPPIPAPYLEDLPQLSDAIRAALGNEKSPLHTQAQLEYQRIKQAIFKRRLRFENSMNVTIVPEPPLQPR